MHKDSIKLTFGPLTIFKDKSNLLFVNLKNVDQSKRAPLNESTVTLPTDWKQMDCLNELGET